MVAALFGITLVHVNLIILILMSIIMLILVVGVSTKNPTLMKISRSVIYAVLGLFGVFRCQDKKDFCYFGIRLNGSKLVVALLLELGIVILTLHIGVALILVHMGVTAIQTLATPILGYLLYPVILASLRKKCS